MNKPRPYVLLETNWKAVKDTEYQLAILPWGATEAHNYHMPYGTDVIEATHSSIDAAAYAWNKGAKPIALPAIPFGVNTGQMDIQLCMNMNPSTQYAILHDVLDVLDSHGIDKLVILNSHGGNHFKQMIRELSLDFPDIFVCSVNWWQSVDSKKYFDEPGDHAGELETSVLMHLTPELLLPLDEAGNGNAKKFAIKGLNEGWASTQRAWTQVTEDTGVGNPALSTAEKGKKFYEATVEKVGEFIYELAMTPVDKLYV